MNFSQAMTPVDVLEKRGWTTEILENENGAVCLIGACRVADGKLDENGQVMNDNELPSAGQYERLARRLQKRREQKGKSRYNLPEDYNDRDASENGVRSFLKRLVRLVRWQGRAEAKRLMTATDVTVEPGNIPALTADVRPQDLLATAKPTATEQSANAS